MTMVALTLFAIVVIAIFLRPKYRVLSGAKEPEESLVTYPANVVSIKSAPSLRADS